MNGAAVGSEDPRIAEVVRRLIDHELRVIHGQRIEGHVWLDGRSFVNCVFVNPHFHSRTGHFGWLDNAIEGHPIRFSFELPLAFAVNTRATVDAFARSRGMEPER